MLPKDIDLDRIPAHVACVMDGNGRWATRRGLKRTDGHAAGEEALFDTVEGALELGLRWLTVYAFSTENWRRPAEEVRFLMGFNERILTATSITVNALRLAIDGGVEIVIASARAGYDSIEPPPPVGDDSISGGGWIPGPNDKLSFGLSAGYVDGILTGHLTFKDHDSGMKMKALTVATYGPAGVPGSRFFEGAAEIDGTSGFTYRVEAADHGEPGDADTFRIELSSGYHAEGVLGGGNIQLHVPGE